jgi:hypothetical protein
VLPPAVPCGVLFALGTLLAGELSGVGAVSAASGRGWRELLTNVPPKLVIEPLIASIRNAPAIRQEVTATSAATSTLPRLLVCARPRILTRLVLMARPRPADPAIRARVRRSHAIDNMQAA